MYHQLYGLISLRRPILRAETAYDTLTILEAPPHRTASLTYSWRDSNLRSTDKLSNIGLYYSDLSHMKRLHVSSVPESGCGTEP
jgi:hypothetical protein